MTDRDRRPADPEANVPAVAPIVDAHHHIWRRADLPWLDGPPVPRIFGEYGPLRRDYPVEEYLADARPSGVARSVYVQTNWAAGREADEVAWVQSIADRHGFPHAIVGFADLAAPSVAGTLDRLTTARGLRGIRQQLHWHVDPAYRFAATPDAMERPAWRRGLGEVARRGLLFELQVFASQMAAGARLARDFPELTVVLLHAGMLEDPAAEGRARWRDGMRALAALPNVHVKLSGLGTFARRCATELWAPVIRETVELFGPARSMFGSNFPIEKMWTSYDELVRVTTECLDWLGPGDRRLVLHDTAARIYRIA
jgi:predicted TIM-barrel fold metal-dependent hydrolase